MPVFSSAGFGFRRRPGESVWAPISVRPAVLAASLPTMKAMIDDEAAALTAFQHFKGPFVRDDLYVVVVDIASGKVLAHGANPALVGTDANAQKSPDGVEIGREMLALARKDGKGEYEYNWRNPLTGRLEKKHSYFSTQNGRLIGVGYFSR